MFPWHTGSPCRGPCTAPCRQRLRSGASRASCPGSLAGFHVALGPAGLCGVSRPQPAPAHGARFHAARGVHLAPAPAFDSFKPPAAETCKATAALSVHGQRLAVQHDEAVPKGAHHNQRTLWAPPVSSRSTAVVASRRPGRALASALVLALADERATHRTSCRSASRKGPCRSRLGVGRLRLEAPERLTVSAAAFRGLQNTQHPRFC